MIFDRASIALIAFAAVNACASIAASAWAAHGLQAVAPTGAQGVDWFIQAAGFQMNHALGVIAATALYLHMQGLARLITLNAALLLAIAIPLFSWSLYALAFDGPAFLAPYGGFAAMLGWLMVGAGVLATLKKN
jgi:uncharacterized membrane protein YgdD (TMEM256/DUF423 family)